LAGNQRTEIEAVGWVKHAYQQSRNGAEVVVMLIPAKTSWSYWRFVVEHAAEIRFVEGRLIRSSRHVAVVVFRKGRKSPSA
jgi:hypothetical protein